MMMMMMMMMMMIMTKNIYLFIYLFSSFFTHVDFSFKFSHSSIKQKLQSFDIFQIKFSLEQYLQKQNEAGLFDNEHHGMPC